MFAIIRTGGKQYRVAPGESLIVEKTGDDLSEKAKVSFSDVICVSDGKATHVGEPKLADAEVKAQLVKPIRTDKVIVFKKKRRNNYRRKHGHRQSMLLLKVEDILLKGKSLVQGAIDVKKSVAKG
jgi:large subunit ribosomal protein L21